MSRWAAAHLADLSPYVPGKPVEVLARELGITDAVKLASNECPRSPVPPVMEAMTAALGQAHRYPDGSMYRLRHVLAAHLQVPPEALVFGNGSNEVIDLLCRTLCTPADHAVIGAPSFVAYDLCLRAANIPLTRVPLRDNLFWDLDGLLAAVQPQTRLLFLDNPNNPTSTHVPGGELAAFLRAVPEQVVVVVDEAYVEFADAEDYRSALSLRETRERLVVLRTFSKAYGLSGLRVGYGITPPPLASYLERVRLPFNVNRVAEAAAVAALENEAARAALDDYVALNRRERQRVAAALGQQGLSVAPSQANFLTVNVQRPAHPVYDGLLRRGVIVRDLGGPLATWLRVSIGLPEENDRFLTALAEVLDGA